MGFSAAAREEAMLIPISRGQRLLQLPLAPWFSVALFQVGRKRQKHPCLHPSHVGSLDRAKWQNTVVKISFFVPHVVHCPAKNRMRQLNVGRIHILKLAQRNEALRHGMTINRVGAVMKVLRNAFLSEEVLPVKLKPLL